MRTFTISLFIISVLTFTLTTPVTADTETLISKVVDQRGFSQMRLSPDNKYIAMIVYRDSSFGLALFDVESKTQKLIIKPQYKEEGFWIFNKQVQNITWVTKDLIAIDFGAIIEIINLEGKILSRLAESEFGVDILGKAEPDKPESTLMLVRIRNDNNQIAIVDAQNGKSKKFDVPTDGKLVGWAFDKQGQLRALTLQKVNDNNQQTSISQWYRPNNNSTWIRLEDKGIKESNWEPLFVPEQDNSIVVISNQGRDTKAIFLYDTIKRQHIEMMAGHPTQDIIGVTGLEKTEFSKVTTLGLMVEQIWLDPTWAAMQAAVDQALPHRINSLSGDPAKFVLVHSYSDVDPGSWHLLDVEKSKLMLIAQSRFGLANVKGYKKYTLHYPSKDGLNIPAYLTLPQGKLLTETKSPTTTSPLVVYIHGGPVSRDHWNWDDDVQILASEGYAVFQPQFRGSRGFGKYFEAAGYREWGLAMQDDITEGVNYLIKQGIADPQKICIYGASYGGFAAMWGLIKTPNMFRCGVSLAGVADIEYMLEDSSDTNKDRTAVELMKYTVGDIKTDKTTFDAVSPLKHANKISAPLLLMHGSDDIRVPIAHSKKMKEAMNKHNKPYEWVIFEDEGHSTLKADNRKRKYEKLTDFLAKYLK